MVHRERNCYAEAVINVKIVLNIENINGIEVVWIRFDATKLWTLWEKGEIFLCEFNLVLRYLKVVFWI